MVARYGGEEFCVVLPETDAEGAILVAERLRAAVAAVAVELPEGSARVTASFGVAAGMPTASADPQEWLARADIALYAAKQGGRDRVVCRDESAAVPA